MGDLSGAMQEAVKKAHELYEQQFLSSHAYQIPEFWFQTLGRQVKAVQDKAVQLQPDVMSVTEYVAEVGALAALADWIVERFGAEIGSRGGS